MPLSKEPLRWVLFDNLIPPVGGHRRFSAENRRVGVFFPGTCPWKNQSNKKAVDSPQLFLCCVT